MSARFETLVGTLRLRAERQPEARAFTFLGDGGEPSLTYAELDRRARAIGARLLAEGMRGQRVLLLHVPGLDFVAAFYGCLYAGAIAVPAYLPEATRAARALPRLRAILDDTAAALVLTTSKLVGDDARALDDAPELAARRLLTSDTLAEGDGDAWAEPEGLGGPAFLQYTSGSTSTPRGVVVTHRQALADLRLIHAAFRPRVDLDAVKDGQPSSVMWLPFYHDMGLVGGILMTPYMGGHTALMSPLDFIKRPIGWLRALQRFGADYTACPNFGLDLCAQKAARTDLTGLDLSALEVLIVGAEPVRPETVRRFVEAFAGHGLRGEDVLYPAYGLAEAVLAVSARRGGEGPVARSFDGAALQANRAVPVAPGRGRVLVSAGRPILEERVAIVDPETREETAEGGVGEIWVAGENVAGGYWNRPAESEASFAARIAASGEGPFLRTGDLGFFCDGELYVAGRLKDLVIVRGQNIHPVDVEATIEKSHPRVRVSAVVSVDVDAGEALALLLEIDPRGLPEAADERRAALDAVIGAVREGVGVEHAAPVAVCAIVRPSSLPRTSSGKIRRSAAREGLLSGELPVIARWDAPAGEAIEEALAAGIAEMMRLPGGSVGPEQRLLELGLDSLAIVELRARLERDLGIAAPLRPWLEGQSVRSLASQIAALARGGEARVPAAVVGRAPAAGTWAALSHGQEALWLVAQATPESTAYNLALAVRLGPGTDEEALRRALRGLSARHAVLRARFEARDGRPAQRTMDAQADALLEVTELQGVSRLEDAGERLADEAHRPFDLAREAPLRVALLPLPSGAPAMLITAHHIAVDLWSLLVLGDELGALYTAEVEGRAPPAAPAATYADFVCWQAELVASAEGERQLAYWRAALEGAPPVLDLPSDRPRPRAPSHRGAGHRIALPAGLSEGLARLARRRGTTLYAVLLAGFQVLLHRLSGQDDIIVGSPTAGRGAAAFAGTVGYFVNPVALRLRLGDDPSFEDALERTAEGVRGALEHQDYPFPLLVERLSPRREAGRSPLFQVMFVFQKPHRVPEAAPFVAGWGGARLSLGALEVESLPLPERAAPFDLTLNVVEVAAGGEGGGREIAITIQYDTGLFDEATVRRFGGQLRLLLEGAVEDPTQRVSALPLLTDEERRFLAAWNATDARVADGAAAHVAFEAQARAFPDDDAAVLGTARISYGELDRRANRLAHHLCGLGVGPEVRVAVAIERSLEWLVAQLAVWKAGGVYVPLDPAHPEARLRFVLEDCRAAVLVTRGALAEVTGARVVHLEHDAPAIDAHPETAPEVAHHPEHAAYVLYTSGSTGTPKGVVVPHRAPLNLVGGLRPLLDVRRGTRLLQFTGNAFDAAVCEVLLALSSGATLFIPPDRDTALPGQRLADWMAEEAIEIAFLNPSTLTLTPDAPLPALRVLFSGAEACTAAIVDRWAVPGRRFFNAYGPTEATVLATLTTCLPGEGVPPIGRPIPNARAHVLDRHLRPAPIGVPGELYLGGPGVARGYLERPGLTAERFLPDPFSAEPGARLYRTGDACRLRADGQLEFLGRLDQQVKIRGFRVELGEVEAALAAHPDVRAAVAVARDDEAGNKRLIAYLVPHRESATAALREHLRATLPEHLVPSAFVWLDALPLTESGKVDHKALPAPEASREGEGELVAPRTATEKALVAVWEELLGVRPIGVRDDFFVLGGHSLLAVRLRAAVEARLGAAMPMAMLFQHPTIEALAAALDAAAAPGGASLQPVSRAPGERAHPRLSGNERRLWFLEQRDPEAHAYQAPQVIRVRGGLDAAALRAAVDALARRHELLRTTYPEVDGAPVREVDDEVVIQIRHHDLGAVPAAVREDAARALVVAEVRDGFDLQRGPLTRVVAIRLAEDEQILLVHQHHIVTDEWSAGVLVRELGALYEAARRGEAAALPALPYQLADLARAEEAALAGDGLAVSRGYWREKVADVPRLDLPILRASSGGPGPEEHRAVRLPDAAGRALDALAKSAGATPFMAFYALVACLFARYGGQRDFGLGAVVANRDHAGSEGLLGFFTNTVVLRTDLSGDPSFREVLRRARGTAVEAYRHQALPFDVVVQDLGVARRPGESPLYDVSLMEVSTPAESGAWSLLSGSLAEGVTAAKNALAIAVERGAAGTEVRVSFDGARVDADAVERLLGHLGTLIEDVGARSDTPLSRLSLLTSAELDALRRWNDTGREVPERRTVHQLVVEQVERTPGAVAIRHGGDEISYAELGARAGRLAHHLRALGVGPDVRVGVCLPRSFDLIVVLLAVLEAGGAYVPLDPTYPPERLAFMLADAQAPVLITRSELRDRLSTGGTVVQLDTDAEARAHLPERPPAVDVDPEHLAYVIYTSGSTGRPKGVAMPHRALARLLGWQRRSSSIPASAPTLQLASPSFDVSFQEIFSTLTAGGTLRLVTEEERLAPAAIWSLLLRGEVERLFLPPVLLQHIAETWQDDGTRGGRGEVIAAGEQLVVTPAIARLLGTLAEAHLHNHYGPTEAHVVSAFAAASPLSLGPVPIGRPNDETQLHVLDAGLAPVPVGVPGELYIAGAGLARGYLGRPGLTAERFVPDPFATEPGARMYRTGDLARWSAGGQLEFLGRRDHQVKIRGFRVELGEVEAALAALPEVGAAAVIAREDTPGERRLAAYLEARPDATPPDAAALRSALQRALPDHMIPAAFVWLGALPLSPNGKVDRKALPAPEATRDDGQHLAPRTATEAALVPIWEAILGVRPIGVRDDFFALGGHSLLTVRLVSAIKAKLGVALPMASLFQHPSVEALAAFLDAAAGGGERPAPGVVLRPSPRALGEPAPADLSGTERRIWFLERLHPGARAYQVPLAIRVGGTLDAEALRAAVDALARRHEALRTTYPDADDTPARAVADQVAIPIQHHDLSAMPAPLREDAAREMVAAEVRTGFDLRGGPLTRVLAVRLAEDEHLLLIHQHHIVTDEWSAAVLVRELHALHDAVLRGAEAALPPLPYQLSDFARAEEEALAGDGFAASRAYWKQQLAHVPRLVLPIVRAAAGGPGPERHRSATLPPAACLALDALARERGATSFMAFYALVACLCARYGGQRDFGLGAVVANRDHPGSEAVLGFFTNTVVLRTDLSGDPSFRAILDRARQTAVGAYQHQALPFDVVVQDLGAPRRPGESPLYDVSFMELAAPDAGATPGWSAWSGTLSGEATAAKEALGLAVQRGPEGTVVRASFDATRVDAGAVERLLEHLSALLAGVVAQPDRPLSALSMLTAAEADRIRRWNDTAAPFPERRGIHQLVEDQARTTPDAVALVLEGRPVTYAELEARSNRLAHHLRALGVGPEVRVGSCVERSFEMVVGLLAILKAGGAYVPLDPAYPRERLAFMLADARVPVLLTLSRLDDRVAFDGTRVRLDADAETWAHQPDTAPETRVEPDQAAYVIYTSGSTGRPKGAINTHRGVVNRLWWMARDYGIAPDDAVLQKTPLSFDVSGWELWLPLVTGARMVLAAPEGHRDPSYLASLIGAAGVTTLHFVPSMLAVFLAARDAAAFPSVRRVFASGEELTPALVAAWYARGGAELHNLYGPTEAAIDVTRHACRRDEGERVPIGRPVDNTRVYVLDRDLCQVPVGIPGEVYLAGVQLARGYLDRPGLTAERFVPDPFGEAGARMYRTGDVGRWTEDGEIEFLGRVDHQVKIRGFRVELGEIEVALGDHPAVAEAAVTVRREGEDAALIGYVVLRAEAAPEALREHLRRRLPDHMVPRTFVVLERMPLGESGKLDRRALPAPEPAPARDRTEAPRDELEALLARVIGEALGRGPAGLHDHFFDELGGTSLSIVRAAGAVSRALGSEVPVLRFFEHPTVAALARGLRGESEAAPALRTSTERAQGRRDAISRARRGKK